MTERPSKNLAAEQDWDKLEEEPSMEIVNKIAAKHKSHRYEITFLIIHTIKLFNP